MLVTSCAQTLVHLSGGRHRLQRFLDRAAEHHAQLILDLGLVGMDHLPDPC